MAPNKNSHIFIYPFSYQVNVLFKILNTPNRVRYNLRAMEIGQGNLKFFNLEVTEYIHRTELSYHLSVSIQEKKMT